jgi:glycosyltransferase involved in cell wall biosynthesis
MSSALPPEHSDIQPPAEPAEPPDHAHTFALPTVLCFVGTYLKPEMWHVYNQVTGLRRHRSIVLTRFRENPHLFPEPQVEIFRHTSLPIWEKFHLKFIARAPREIYKGYKQSLQRSFDATRPDLLHIYFGHEATRLARTLAHFDIPWLVSFHGADLGRYVLRPDDRTQLPLVFQNARLILARCQYFIPRLIELGCPKEKIRLNRTHIRPELFPFTERDWAPADGAWQWCQASRFLPKKGLTDTIQAFHLFHKKHPRAHLHLAGDGPQRPEIENRIRNMRLSEHVTLHGMLDRAALNALYARSHIFLHPSITDASGDMEGVPNSLLEAMSTGLVCVGTRHAGIPEVLADGENGLLVPEKEPHTIAERLLDLVTRPENMRALSHRAAEHIRAHYTPEHQITLLEDCYNQALGNNL